MKLDPIPIAIGISSIIIIAVLIFLAGRNSNSDDPAANSSAASTQESEQPAFEISEESLYLSTQTYTAQKDLIITNTGKGELSLDNIRVSCDCFSAVFYIDQSAKRLKSVKLKPKEQVILRTDFSRERYSELLSRDQSIIFKTNDPKHPEEKIDIFSLE